MANMLRSTFLCVFLLHCAEFSQGAPELAICLAEYCSHEVEECTESDACKETLNCVIDCMAGFNNDTTPEKYKSQNCTNTCVFSYGDGAYVELIKCGVGHYCVNLPIIYNKCKSDNVTFLRELSVKDLEGPWWVVQGANPVYDCYPCQYWTIEQNGATLWKYTPKYEVYLEDGSLKVINETILWSISEPGPEIIFEFSLAGFDFKEHWWLIDAADDMSYILIYYCGNTLDWFHDGAVVLSRKKTLSLSDYARIKESFYKGVGLDTVDFCKTNTADCPY